MTGRPYLPLLEASLEHTPVIKRGDYPYFVHPLTDGVPPLEPTLLKEVVEAMVALADLDCDCILTAEAMGLPLSTALSLRTGLPLNIIRKRPYLMDGELKLQQQTGYHKGPLYINSLSAGDRVLIVDDVVSTGGTLKAIVAGLRELKVVIQDLIVVFEKCDLETLEAKLEMPVKTLLKIEIDPEGGVAVVDH